MKHKWIKGLLVFVALISFGLGAVGAVLPIVPTTPFLLLSSFLFTKSSERFNRWFKGTKLYKDYLETLVRDRAMTVGAKLFVLLPISTSLLTVVVLVDVLPLRIGIVVLMIVKYYYFLFRIKTISRKSRRVH